MVHKILIIILVMVQVSCASQMKVKSEPAQADVSVYDAKTGTKKPLGKTPLDIPTALVKEAVGQGALPGEYFSILIEKDGFASEKLLVPVSGFGTLVTSLEVKLKQGVGLKEEQRAKEILDHLFLAQNFAKSKEYERAQIELDKILTEIASFPRALSMRGSIYFMQKNFPESLKWYEKALSVDPQMQDAVKMTAKIHGLQNDGKGSENKKTSRTPGKN